MTDPQDELVAEAIEPKPFDWARDTSPKGAWYYLGFWKPRPFISNATPATEHIVREYAQAKCADIIVDKLYEIIVERIADGWRDMYSRAEAIFFYYKLGDYALAVLEVLSDGN